MNALRPFNMPPGNYGFPRPGSMADMKTPAFQAKNQGRPGRIHDDQAGWQHQHGRNLFQWFLYSLIVSVFAGYIAGVAFGPGTEYLRIMQVAGCVRSPGMRWRKRTNRSGGAGGGPEPSAHARRTALRTAHRRDVRVALAEDIRI